MEDFPHHLVVIHDFETYRRGDKITDVEECHRIIASDTAHHVHRVTKDEEPVSEAKPKKTKSE